MIMQGGSLDLAKLADVRCLSSEEQEKYDESIKAADDEAPAFQIEIFHRPYLLLKFSMTSTKINVSSELPTTLPIQ